MKSFFLKRGNSTSTLMLISVLAILIFPSCKKNEIENKSDNYYVIYIINGNGVYGRFSNWTATTPQGTYTNSGYQTKIWNQTYGPVKKVLYVKFRLGII